MSHDIIIMTHGDNNGLVLPRIAPFRLGGHPMAQHKEGVLEAASALLDRLKAAASRPG